MNLFVATAAASLLFALFLLFMLKFFLARPHGDAFHANDGGETADAFPGGCGVPRYGPASYPVREGRRGEARTCPVCAAKFEHGETVRSKLFPATGRQDRLMHISGCPFCLNGERRRECPVCGEEISIEEYLVARMFPRIGKTHVHISGCSRCSMGKKKPKSGK